MLFVLCWAGLLPAQSVTLEGRRSFHFCDDPPVQAPLSPAEGAVQDRWNRSFSRLDHIPTSAQGNRQAPNLIDGPKTLAPVDCGSGFILIFEDIESETGTGFDDPSPSPCGGGLTMGEERVNTACEVFNYIATVIDMGGVNVEIYFPPAELAGDGALASATPLFDAGIPPGTYMGGYLRDHIVNGVDPNPSEYDAVITFDFGTRYLGGEAFDISPCLSCPESDELDMYSILLHEATHTLGFFSRLTATGASSYSMSTDGPYSIFDDYILNGAATGLLDVAGIFSGPLGDLTLNVLDYYAPGNTQPSPVYSPITWNPGSSGSHFDPDRSDFRFVMSPSTDGGDDRLYTMAEIEVLYNLGYTLGADIFTSPTTFNTYPVATDDVGYTTLPGETICVPALDNDTDPDGDPLSYGDCGSGCDVIPTGPELILGSGTVEIVGDEICYTPYDWYTGSAIIKYCPTDGKYDSDFVNTDNCAFIFIDVMGPCLDDPCNLVCNGNFENRADNCVEEFDFNNLSECPAILIDNMCRTRGSIDLYVRGCPDNSDPEDYFDIPRNYHSGLAPLPGTQTWDWPNPDNNTYVGMIHRRTSIGHAEGFYMKLSEPLEVGQSYTLSFKAGSKQQDPLGGSSDGKMLVGFTSTEPVPGMPWNNSVLEWYAQGNSPAAADITIPGTSKLVTGTWSTHTFTITPTVPNLKYIVFEGSLIGPVTGIQNHLFLDEVRLENDAPNIYLQKTVSNPCPEPGETITYTIVISNMDPVKTAFGLEIHDLLPDGVTYVSSTFSDPPTTHIIPAMFPMTSMILTLTVTVDEDAPIGVPITNCVFVDGDGDGCLNTEDDNCVDITVKGTEIVVTKTVSSGPGPYMPGDMVSFEITVDNAGPMDATGLLIEDILPIEMTYVSHSVVGPGSFSLPNLNIASLPSGDQTVLTLNVIINSLATCETLTNCATLLSLDQYDISIGNNSDCAEVEVGPPGGSPSAYPVHPAGADVERAHGLYKTTNGLYVTGNLNNQIDFGYGPMLTSGGRDAFVVKYGECGVEWQHSEGGPAPDEGIAILEHPMSGRVYACGNIGQTFNYQGVDLVGSGCYVVELNPANGLALWGKVIQYASVEDIALDPVTGHVAITGSHIAPFTFGGSSFMPVAPPYTDLFVAVYDADGNEVWADSYGSPLDDKGKGLAFDPMGNLFISGSIGSMATSLFGATIPAFAGGSSDGIVGRYTGSGARIDAHYFASPGEDAVNDIDIHSVSGEVYVVGNNGGTMVIGGGPTIASYGNRDAFVAQLTNAMIGVWAHDLGGPAKDYGEAIAEEAGTVYISGGFQNFANFPGFPLSTISSYGQRDIFMATINAATGVPINNLHSLTYNHWIDCYDVVTNGAGNGYIAGDFYKKTMLGVASMNSPDGAADAYIARGDGNVGGVFFRSPQVLEEETESSSLVEVYPNPSSGRLTIRRIGGNAESIRLEVVDIHGKRELLEEAAVFSAGELTLDLSDRAQGLYFLKVETDHQQQTVKVVLMND